MQNFVDVINFGVRYVRLIINACKTLYLGDWKWSIIEDEIYIIIVKNIKPK